MKYFQRFYQSSFYIFVVIFLFVGCGGGGGDDGEDPKNVKSITPYYSKVTQSGTSWPLTALVTDGTGTPIENLRVDWRRVEGDQFGALATLSGITEKRGYVITHVDKIGVGTIKVKAKIYGYDAYCTFTFSF